MLWKRMKPVWYRTIFYLACLASVMSVLVFRVRIWPRDVLAVGSYSELSHTTMSTVRTTADAVVVTINSSNLILDTTQSKGQNVVVNKPNEHSTEPNQTATDSNVLNQKFMSLYLDDWSTNVSNKSLESRDKSVVDVSTDNVNRTSDTPRVPQPQASKDPNIPDTLQDLDPSSDTPLMSDPSSKDPNIPDTLRDLEPSSDTPLMSDPSSKDPNIPDTLRVSDPSSDTPLAPDPSSYVPLGPDQEEPARKRILLWNAWYKWDDYMFGVGSQPFLDKCGLDTCAVTLDRQELAHVEAVVVFGALLLYNDSDPAPPRAHPDQLYVYVNQEPPRGLKNGSYHLDNMFNITASYRTDSSLYWPYGVFTDRRTGRLLDPLKDNPSDRWPPNHRTSINNLQDILANITSQSAGPDSVTSGSDSVTAGPDSLPTDPDTVTLETIRTKTKAVAWLVSHCTDWINVRMEYVRELQRHIQVDIYGKCGDMQCKKGRSEQCMAMIEDEYYFYLALENSVCEDYVTEKLYRTLRYRLVPVVMGGANYTRLLPPHSFLDARDFPTPRALAAHLQFLIDQPSLYLRHLSWHEDYVVTETITYSQILFCKLCRQLSQRTDLQVYRDFSVGDWWERSRCVSNQDDMRRMYGLVT